MTDVATPYERLAVLASQEAEVAPGVQHLELYTMEGLLTILWHGDPGAKGAVVACGGAMGGLLGPDGIYPEVAAVLARRGIATLRIGFRRPGELGKCKLDVAAAVEMAARHGADRVVTMGHSFGGAVAVRVAAALPDVVAGVVTLATQSAGCEVAPHLAGRPLLMFHGDADELLPVAASETVRTLAGGGELVVIPRTGHLFTGATPEIVDRLDRWLPAVLDGTAMHET
jgi:pimeloyl-ACP methyl ester carboxylesterase